MKNITKEEILELKTKTTPTVVKYGIEGCMPCLMAEETLNDMDLGDVQLFSCNDVDYMTTLGIESMPVIYIYGNGKEERINAYEVLDELDSIVETTLTKF